MVRFVVGLEGKKAKAYLDKIEMKMRLTAEADDGSPSSNA